MSEELEVLKMVSQELGKAGILYMITGSMASNFYAAPRMTRDIDIVIEVQKEDIEKLLALFEKDFYIDRETVLEAVEKQGMFNMIHNRYVVKIDFIIRKESDYRKLEFQRRKQTQLEGIKMSIVSAEDLILSKLFWAKDSFSEMQLGDVKNLLRMVKGIDRAYLEKWIAPLGLQGVYEKVKS